ncbi:MAG: hypothetical protein EBS05_27380 [Proteobacteria bacterium]|nr:hypothetical protein [Pseudomonadota bacterium]
MGTPHFMSPEQAEGKIAELDGRSDIFSLGGILYALLTLRPPVEGDSLEEILSKVRSGTIAPPTDSLVALAQMPAVQNIEAYQSPLFMNDLSRVRLDVSVGGVDATTTNANWLNLTGNGVTVGLPGSGVDLGHPELAGQTFLNASSPATDVNGHETYTAGAIVALGSTTPTTVYGSLPGSNQRGIAHGAKVYPLSFYSAEYTNYGNFWIATNMATATNIHIVKAGPTREARADARTPSPLPATPRTSSRSGHWSSSASWPTRPTRRPRPPMIPSRWRIRTATIKSLTFPAVAMSAWASRARPVA